MYKLEGLSVHEQVISECYNVQCTCIVFNIIIWYEENFAKWSYTKQLLISQIYDNTPVVMNK